MADVPDWLIALNDPDLIRAWIALGDDGPDDGIGKAAEIHIWIRKQNEFTTRDLAIAFGISQDQARRYAKKWATPLGRGPRSSDFIVWKPKSK